MSDGISPIELIRSSISAFASGFVYGVKTPGEAGANSPFFGEDLNEVYLIGIYTGRKVAAELNPQE
jgi:hypothetical protein